MDKEQAKQEIIATLPNEGEMAYDDLEQALTVSGKRLALTFFHALRRKQEIPVQVRVVNGVVKLFVSRPAQA